MNPQPVQSFNIQKSFITQLLALLLFFISGNAFSQPVCDAHFQFYTNNHNPDSVHFYTTNPTSTVASYLWTFGDGTTSTDPNPWHLYQGQGAYWVCLTVTLSNNTTCNWCDSVHVMTPPPPPPPVCNAHFQFYTNPHNSDSLHFYPQNPSTNPATYLWSFGDGTTSTNNNPWHLYQGPGAYWVCLTVTLSNGTTCTWCDSIHVINSPPPPPPVCNANFQFYTNNHNPDSVHFYTTNPTSNVATYSWTFGDGTTSTDPNPWHLYPGPGAYWVCLTVTLSNNTTCTWCDSVHVMTPPPPPPPVCNAHFQSTFLPHNPDSIHFLPQNATTNLATYSWSFGDGTTSTAHDPWHVYANPGAYWVCLTTTLSNGTTCTWCDSVHVMNPPPPPPPVCNAHFQFYRNPHNPDSIHFNPSPVPASNIASYLWSFGDGTTSTDPNPWHFYPNSGAYTVCLTVTLVNGTSCTWCKVIHILNPPPPPPQYCHAHFQFNHSPQNPSNIHFYPPPSPASNLATYFWTFGDGTTSTNHDPWHLYANPGAYLVCLTITLSNGATCTWCDSIHVFNQPPPPVCNAHFQFNVNPHNPDSVHYFPQMNVAASYLWSFGDGTTSTSHDPWHLYAAPGMYFTCLTVTDMNGNTCTWCDSVQGSPVHPGPVDQYRIADQTAVSIYPNPANGTITISTQNIPDQTEFEIYDLTGNRVFQTIISRNSVANINTSLFNEGMYYYFIRNGDQSISQGRMVVLH